MLSDKEFAKKCQELKEMSQNIRAKLSKDQQDLDKNIAQAYTLPQIRQDRVITPSAAAGQVQVKRIHPAKLAQRRRDYKRANMEEAEAQPANVPFTHYEPEDRIELVKPSRPASMRKAIPYINVTGPDQTWEQLNEWRAAYGLPPVTR